MIQYTLRCENEHRFDSWFQSASAFDKLMSNGMLTCETCGSNTIEKAIMAPRVRTARSAATAPAQGESDPPIEQSLTTPETATERAIVDLKKHIEDNADYVGGNFAKEARSMHLGDTPERSIYGEANAEEARNLIEEGIPVAPLPFRPGRKSS